LLDETCGQGATDEWIDDPIDEDFELSAEGGEVEYLQEYSGSVRSHHAPQQWSTRIVNADTQWEWQLPHLIDAYLSFMHQGSVMKEQGHDPFNILYIDLFGMCPWFIRILAV
jgi:hypothetical protein